jgi:hypothetical protein
VRDELGLGEAVQRAEQKIRGSETGVEGAVRVGREVEGSFVITCAGAAAVIFVFVVADVENSELGRYREAWSAVEAARALKVEVDPGVATRIQSRK